MAVLEVNNLKKSFDRTEVLKDISFSLEKGEVLSIIGSSGSGKTTLLRCLNFLERAEKGTIAVNGKEIFNGENLKKTPESVIRENRLHFGLVFQSFNLFPQYTVLQNITLAPTLLKRGTPEEIEEKAKSLIARVGLTEKTDFYPCQLSGGQQQRVAIAR
ncbi:MAG: amino acid ABC transporter ATP-binding protein, partial [Clostridia bacterium]|nr:amino acid ABC transporter ATP-binding protein [Clostridia bacterium]